MSRGLVKITPPSYYICSDGTIVYNLRVRSVMNVPRTKLNYHTVPCNSFAGVQKAYMKPTLSFSFSSSDAFGNKTI